MPASGSSYDGGGSSSRFPGARGDYGGEVPPPQPTRATRALSALSAEAIAGLRETAGELERLQGTTEEIAFQLDCGTVTAVQARTELAQVESQAKRLECERVDAVYTSELSSGKAEAKSEKKDQLAKLEALFQRLEGLFARIKALERG